MSSKLSPLGVLDVAKSLETTDVLLASGDSWAAALSLYSVVDAAVSGYMCCSIRDGVLRGMSRFNQGYCCPCVK